MIQLNTIVENPDNPRQITKVRLEELMDSIEGFPKMMSIRPMVIITKDGKTMPLGGNMRLKAMKALGYTEIPDDWVKDANELTEQERKRFIIVDNENFGTWDDDLLANNWNIDDLSNWGLHIPGLDEIKATKDIPGQGEMEFSDSLLLEHNYIVLYFDNPMDWEVAIEKFGLKQVKTNTPKNSQKIGVGRVVNGRKFL